VRAVDRPRSIFSRIIARLAPSEDRGTIARAAPAGLWKAAQAGVWATLTSASIRSERRARKMGEIFGNMLLDPSRALFWSSSGAIGGAPRLSAARHHLWVYDGGLPLPAYYYVKHGAPHIALDLDSYCHRARHTFPGLSMRRRPVLITQCSIEGPDQI